MISRKQRSLGNFLYVEEKEFTLKASDWILTLSEVMRLLDECNNDLEHFSCEANNATDEDREFNTKTIERVSRRLDLIHLMLDICEIREE